jgi:hypothetical protein
MRCVAVKDWPGASDKTKNLPLSIVNPELNQESLSQPLNPTQFEQVQGEAKKKSRGLQIKIKSLALRGNRTNLFFHSAFSSMDSHDRSKSTSAIVSTMQSGFLGQGRRSKEMRRGKGKTFSI